MVFVGITLERMCPWWVSFLGRTRCITKCVHHKVAIYVVLPEFLPSVLVFTDNFVTPFLILYLLVGILSKKELSLLPYLFIYITVNSGVIQWLRIQSYCYFVLKIEMCPLGTLSRCFLCSVDLFPLFFKHIFTFCHNKMLSAEIILLQPQSWESTSLKSLIPFSGNGI